MKTRARKPFQVHLDESQLGVLRWLAERRGVSVAELVRQSVDCYLAQLPPEDDPLWGIIGIGLGGPPDLAERHDDYLVEEFLKHHHG